MMDTNGLAISVAMTMLNRDQINYLRQITHTEPCDGICNPRILKMIPFDFMLSNLSKIKYINVPSTQRVKKNILYSCFG